MIKILIDPASIKRNPNAGNTSVRVKGPTIATFQFNGTGRIPHHLLDKVEITGWLDHPDEKYGYHQSGYIINPSDVELLLKEATGISIKIDNNVQVYPCMPESEYLYKHTIAFVPCNNCGKEVLDRDIKEDCDDEGNSFLVCENCGEIDTFDYTYEHIEEAIERLGPNFIL